MTDFSMKVYTEIQSNHIGENVLVFHQMGKNVVAHIGKLSLIGVIIKITERTYQIAYFKKPSDTWLNHTFHQKDLFLTEIFPATAYACIDNVYLRTQ